MLGMHGHLGIVGGLYGMGGHEERVKISLVDLLAAFGIQLLFQLFQFFDALLGIAVVFRHFITGFVRTAEFVLLPVDGLVLLKPVLDAFLDPLAIISVGRRDIGSELGVVNILPYMRERFSNSLARLNIIPASSFRPARIKAFA